MSYYQKEQGSLFQVRRRRVASFAADLIVALILSIAFVLLVLTARYFLSEVKFDFIEKITSGETLSTMLGIANLSYICLQWYAFSSSNQATVGMRIFSLRIKPFGGGNYNFNSFVFPVLYYPVALTCIIAIFPIYLSFFTSKFKRLPHDMFLKTIFVRSDI